MDVFERMLWLVEDERIPTEIDEALTVLFSSFGCSRHGEQRRDPVTLRALLLRRRRSAVLRGHRLVA